MIEEVVVEINLYVTGFIRNKKMVRAPRLNFNTRLREASASKKYHIP
jgi:hypothetical protein